MTTALFATIGALALGAGVLLWLLLRSKRKLGLAEQRIATLEKNLDAAREQLRIAQASRPGSGLTLLDGELRDEG